MEKLSCDIVRDLLPNYVENLTSDNTNKSMEEHISTCESCQSEYQQMILDIPVEKAPKVKEVKKYIQKMKAVYMMYITFILGFLGVFTSIIVDLVINKGLTWSLIVTSSVVLVCFTTFVIIKSKKNKIIKGLLCLSILVIPLLGVIQFVVYQYLDKTSGIWLWNMGLPITFIWLVIMWSCVAVQKLFKLNWAFAVAFMILLSIPGNLLTNIISNSFDWVSIVVNIFSSVIAGFVFILLGLKVKNME